MTRIRYPSNVYIEARVGFECGSRYFTRSDSVPGVLVGTTCAAAVGEDSARNLLEASADPFVAYRDPYNAWVRAQNRKKNLQGLGAIVASPLLPFALMADYVERLFNGRKR